jgi:hypothetical protein
MRADPCVLPVAANAKNLEILNYEEIPVQSCSFKHHRTNRDEALFTKDLF